MLFLLFHSNQTPLENQEDVLYGMQCLITSTAIKKTSNIIMDKELNLNQLLVELKETGENF